MPNPMLASEGWPLILVGPMLRRVDAAGVSVFVALRADCEVLLTVRDGQGHVAASGSATTRRIGEHLHVIVVTAAPTGAGLQPGATYTYDVSLREATAGAPVALAELGLLSGGGCLGFTPGALPSFAMPADAGSLRLAHSSCRKPHGRGADALPLVDAVIGGARDDPKTRPHQLFLTGDQIYADDVALLVLHLAHQIGTAALEGVPEENLPGVTNPLTLQPGQRWSLRSACGFTSEAMDSHLMTFAEFCGMYLLAWSPVLWPTPLPSAADVLGPLKFDAYLQSKYAEQFAPVQDFARGTASVRRALANVPTLMIFDDHEVTDDWFLDRGWRDKVLALPLGRRILVNALSAYVLFQGWGNDPAKLAAGAGEQALDQIAAAQGEPSDELAARLGVGATAPADRLLHDFTLDFPSHQVVVLDTRTHRGFPSPAASAPADLLTAEEITRQLTARRPATPRPLTIVVSAAPVIEHPYVEARKQSSGHELDRDREMWKVAARPAAIEGLLAALASYGRVAVLSGDVHYGYTVGFKYWDHREDQERFAAIAQFVSSPAKNSEPKTAWIDQAWGVRGWALASPHGPEGFLGWSQPGRHLFDGNAAIMVEHTPAIVRVPRGDSEVPPGAEWRYEVSWCTDFATAADRGLRTPTASPTGSGNIADAADRARRQRATALLDQQRLIVGENNIGVVALSAAGDWLEATHDLWWGRAELPPAAYTSHRVSLNPPFVDPADDTQTVPPRPAPLGITGKPENLEPWQGLLSFRPPAALQRRLTARGDSARFHRVERGWGTLNADLYRVVVTRLPTDGTVTSASDLFHTFRARLADFLDPAISIFERYDATEQAQWLSDDPLGALCSFKIFALTYPVDHGTVMCTAFDGRSWTFSTVETPAKDWRHPVAGNRRFGYVENASGSYTYYTRAADRTTTLVDWTVHAIVFDGADRLWRSLQQRLSAFVNDHGGEAQTLEPFSNRYAWDPAMQWYHRPVESWIE